MADALVSGASVRKDVEVQLLSAAPQLALVRDAVTIRHRGRSSVMRGHQLHLNSLAATMAALALFSACGSPAVAPNPAVAKISPSPIASPSPVVSPSASPVTLSSSLLVFVKPGAVALVRPDGTVADTTKTPMDSADIAQYEFDLSDAALIGHYWGADGNPALPLAFSVYDQNGRVTTVPPAAAKVLNDVDIFRSPIIVAGHYLLVIRATVPASGPPTSAYTMLDLATGKVTTLLTATSRPAVLPPGALGGEPHEVDMTPLGTAIDGSVARVMVVHAIVNGASISGAAYFDIDLRSLQVTGPHALPTVGTLAISADERYAAWSELRIVGGKGVRDLHILELVTGRQTTIADGPFSNESAHGGIKFSPDDSYVSLEGYGAASMGFAVFDVRSSRLLQSIAASQPNEPLANVPLWWTDSHTLVYQATAASGVKVGHRLEVVSGAQAEYPSELGTPVVMLSGPPA
jgi:hypothetical protein